MSSSDHLIYHMSRTFLKARLFLFILYCSPRPGLRGSQHWGQMAKWLRERRVGRRTGVFNFQSWVFFWVPFEGRPEGPGASSWKDLFPLFGLESGWACRCSRKKHGLRQTQSLGPSRCMTTTCATKQNCRPTNLANSY